MFACLIIGDSIALGTGAAVNAIYRSGCDIRAVVGATTAAALRWRPPQRVYDTCILSLGSNDAITRPLLAELTRVRRSVCHRRVIWLLPYRRSGMLAVNSIAVSFGDEVLDLIGFPSTDGIHPRSYRAVARKLLR